MLHTSTNPLLTRRTKIGLTVTLFAVMPIPADAALVSYEGDILPEEMGFERSQSYDPDRWIQDGWFVHEMEVGDGPGGPFGGQRDAYDMSLGSFVGQPFFIEWRLLTNAPVSEVDGHNGGAFLVLVGAGVRYHFNMTDGLARILRGYPFPTEYFEVEPGVPHTYRLEVYGGDYFEFLIDSEVADSGLPEDVWPTPDALLSWGSQYYLSPHTAQWDYVRFGSIPEPATALLLAAGALLIRRPRQRRHR